MKIWVHFNNLNQIKKLFNMNGKRRLFYSLEIQPIITLIDDTAI